MTGGGRNGRIHLLLKDCLQRTRGTALSLTSGDTDDHNPTSCRSSSSPRIISIKLKNIIFHHASCTTRTVMILFWDMILCEMESAGLFWEYIWFFSSLFSYRFHTWRFMGQVDCLIEPTIHFHPYITFAYFLEGHGCLMSGVVWKCRSIYLLSIFI